MATVQALLYRFVLRIDPLTKDQSNFTLATVGMIDGDMFSAQRQLDIYNEARIALFNALQLKLTTEELTKAIGGNIVVTNITFFGGVAPKPTGYVKFILLIDSAKNVIVLLPNTKRALVIEGINPDYIESSTNRFIFEEGTNFKSASGDLYMPNGSSYIFGYFGITNWTLGDVTAGTAVETFNDVWHSVILEIGQAIANEQGLAQINALAISLVGGK